MCTETCGSTSTARPSGGDEGLRDHPSMVAARYAPARCADKGGKPCEDDGICNPLGQTLLAARAQHDDAGGFLRVSSLRRHAPQRITCRCAMNVAPHSRRRNLYQPGSLGARSRFRALFSVARFGQFSS